MSWHFVNALKPAREGKAGEEEEREGEGKGGGREGGTQQHAT